ncbi:MAG: 3-deoxy-D-manno-octulosonate cytidylyltransferase [Elusimicrobia bacterium GWA2_61_42]|nr:MAG: 3-deoxy-D-manno-octulosonate cytidylyltransferase [Elusimicrobia bacterium GWA2_61_42]OGR74725.1 MAG: 3-deoxy-D-manno-octulosonate cytidylyltransferase [Elusimicrobia bacterium GWC2_61_25]
MDKSCLIVIPARYGSQRFPGKVLAPLAGKPVIQWCWEAAVRTGLGEVIIATEHEKVLSFARSIGARAVMTSPRCQSGTDRVREAARGTRAKFVLNFQGDEPFMLASTLLKAFRKLAASPDCAIGTACSRITRREDLENPNCVKVAMNAAGRALYFSRCPIPFHHPLSDLKGVPHYKHCGFYIYRREALEKFVKLKPSPLERLERLEQLRALENGMKIAVAEVPALGPAIDVPADLGTAEAFLKKRLKK